MSEAEHCDRAVLMFAGRLVADAAPADLRAEVEREAGHVLQVAVDDPVRAAAHLTAQGFASAALHGRRLRLLSRDPAADGRRVEGLLAAAGVAVHGMESAALTMEDVFVYRVTALERAQAGA